MSLTSLVLSHFDQVYIKIQDLSRSFIYDIFHTKRSFLSKQEDACTRTEVDGV